MPQPTTLLMFLLAGAVLVLTPGPNLIYILTRATSQGTRAGIISALGVETGTMIHIAAAAIGLSTLLATSALAFELVRYAGAAYLIYLGIRAITSQPHPPNPDTAPPTHPGRVFGDGVLVNVLNPKVALFFLAFLPQFTDPTHGPITTQILILGLLLASMGLTMDLACAIAGGGLSQWLGRHPRLLNRQRFLVGGVYIGMGAAAALTGRR